MKLFKTKSKNGKYIDYYLLWEHDGKTYKVHVKPSFPSDFPLMFAQAENVDCPLS